MISTSSNNPFPDNGYGKEEKIRCAYCNGPTRLFKENPKAESQSILRCLRCGKILYSNGVPKNPIEGKFMCVDCKKLFIRTEPGQLKCPNCR